MLKRLENSFLPRQDTSMELLLIALYVASNKRCNGSVDGACKYSDKDHYTTIGELGRIAFYDRFDGKVRRHSSPYGVHCKKRVH